MDWRKCLQLPYNHIPILLFGNYLFKSTCMFYRPISVTMTDILQEVSADSGPEIAQEICLGDSETRPHCLLGKHLYTVLSKKTHKLLPMFCC